MNAVPERDTVYTTDDGLNRTTTTYTRESSATGWFVGIIVALALLAIGYLVFSANSGPSTSTTVNNTPAIEAPATGTETAPMTEAPAAAPEATPMAPATDAAPVDAAPVDAAPAAPADAAPATEAPAAPAQ
jgi:hypothetical protein